VLLVVEVVTFILVARLRTLSTLPTALSVFETLLEFTNIEGSILPCVLTLAIRLSVLVLSCVSITIFEEICSLAMLQALLPFSLIAIAVLPCMHTIALGL